MSATRDKNQRVQFFYGNAVKQLSEFMPADESPIQSNQSEMELINSQIDRSLDTLAQLQAANRHISFLVRDMKRVLG